MELGVGNNTSAIVKYPFWQLTQQNLNSTYACLNLKEAFAPKEIASQSICINKDIAKVIQGIFALCVKSIIAL